MLRARHINIARLLEQIHDRRSTDRITSPRTCINCRSDRKQIYLSRLNLIKCNESLVY